MRGSNTAWAWTYLEPTDCAGGLASLKRAQSAMICVPRSAKPDGRNPRQIGGSASVLPITQRDAISRRTRWQPPIRCGVTSVEVAAGHKRPPIAGAKASTPWPDPARPDGRHMRL